MLANAKGDYSNEIKGLLGNIPEENFIEIEFEEDLSALYRLFSIYVHTPIDASSEAFGQTYIESQLCGRKSIFTLSGVLSEIHKNSSDVAIVPYRNIEAIFEAMQSFLSVRECNCQEGTTNTDNFDIKVMVPKLESLYLSIL